VFSNLQKKTYPFRYAIAWALLVLLLSGIPGKSIPTLSFHAEDKVGHFVVYAILAYLWFRALRNNQLHSYFNIFWVVTACVAWGFGMELMQKYVFIDRSFDYMDALANSIGVFLALIFCLLIRMFR
jgi:VanZ family protein